MFYKKIKVAAYLATYALLVVSPQAQTKENTHKTSVSVEMDPITLGFQGYGAHFRINPEGSRFLFGAGLYAMDFPDLLVDINPKNRDMKWHVRLNQGLGLFGEYYFTEANHKFFLGSQMGTQEFEIKNASLEGKRGFTNLLVMGYGGYVWHPFAFNLYIKPWAGLGYTTPVSGSTSLGGKTYAIFPVIAFSTLHIGYTF